MGLAIYSFSRFVLRRLIHNLMGCEIRGREHVPPTGPLIVASNHVSYLDPIILGIAFDRPLSFMARRSLFANPLFAWCIREHFAFPIDREGDIREAIGLFSMHLAQGQAVVMFPEGTRSATGRLSEIKGGVGLIAVKNRAPVLPVYIWGTYYAWPRHRRWPRPHRIKAFIGETIIPRAKEEDRKTAQTRIVEAVKEQLNALEIEAWRGESDEDG